LGEAGDASAAEREPLRAEWQRSEDGLPAKPQKAR
jgi:hypothetical protein